MFHPEPTRKKLKSQIAIIITLVIAALFLLTIVYINVFKVTNIKDITSRAVDKNALALASQLGSMSKAYYHQLGDSVGPVRIFDVKVLKYFIIYDIVLFFATIFNFFSPLIAGQGIFYLVSALMASSISNSWNNMSDYNHLREQALFSTVAAIQSDDLQLRVTSVPGVFQEYDDVTRSFKGTCVQDPITHQYGPDCYDLRTIPAMLAPTARTVSRFEAWYYTKRLPMVDESGLRNALDNFLSTTPNVGILRYIETAGWIPSPTNSYDLTTNGWDSVSGKFATVSLVTYDTPPAYNYPIDPLYEITCIPPNCPKWVRAAVAGPYTYRVRMEGIGSAPYTAITWGDVMDRVPDPNIGGYEVLEWESFLTDRLYSINFSFNLLERLKTDYPGDPNLGLFIDHNSGSSTKLNYVIKDLQHSLSKIKDLLEMPVNLRLKTITQWFPAFYDAKKHQPASNGPCSRLSIDDTSCNSSCCRCSDPNLDQDYSYDIYLRFIRDICYLEEIINALTDFDNNTLTPDIQKNYDGQLGGPSLCRQGDRNQVAFQCPTTLVPCIASHCDFACNLPVTVGQKCGPLVAILYNGNYGTCTGDGLTHNDHPVCSNPFPLFGGDLYGSRPAWCDDLLVGATPACTSTAIPCDCSKVSHTCCGSPNPCVSCGTICNLPDDCCQNTDICNDPSLPRYCPPCPPVTVPAVNTLPPPIPPPPALSYQGQLSWRDWNPSKLPGPPIQLGSYDGTLKPTEVKQAIDLLGGLWNTLYKINVAIEHLADEIAKMPTDLAPIRNELVYAWRDRQHQNNMPPQYAHFVRARLINYPEELPHITMKEEWGGLWKVYTLNAYEGDFDLLAARYDQDQPSTYWNLRRRAQPLIPEINPGQLNMLVNIVNLWGFCNFYATPQLTALGNQLFTQSIWSRVRAHYGYDRTKIFLEQTEDRTAATDTTGGMGTSGGY